MQNESIKILVIEDDSTMREGIQTVLEKTGYAVSIAKDGYEGSRLFRQQMPHLVITDLKLPGKSGMDLLQEFKDTNSKIEVILISAYGTIDLAVNALKMGARDFIAKPFSIDELRTKVENVIVSSPKLSGYLLKEQATIFHGMIGDSSEMQNLYDKIREVGKVESPVLITGESGTGKELVAKAIHEESDRNKQKFVAVNCGALTESLLESELFGHEKGAFTGAVQQHHGVFEQANRGTIFLDEVGEISPRMQVKLLRVLQYQTFQRVGGSETINTDVRIIAATNRDLKAAVKEITFREDLYFRLNVIPLHLPALRERSEDIPALVKHIARKKARQLNRDIPEWTKHSLEKLQQYSWPGNIRELENFLERLLLFNKSTEISSRDIYLDDLQDEYIKLSGSLPEILENTEYKMIVDALRKSNGVKQQAARLLGINTSTLYYKMDKYGIMHETDD